MVPIGATLITRSEVIPHIHIQLVFPLIAAARAEALAVIAAADVRIVLADQPFGGDPQFAHRERGAEDHALGVVEAGGGFLVGAVVGVELDAADLVEQVFAADVVAQIGNVQVGAAGDVIGAVVAAEGDQFVGAGVAWRHLLAGGLQLHAPRAVFANVVNGDGVASAIAVGVVVFQRRGQARDADFGFPWPEVERLGHPQHDGVALLVVAAVGDVTVGLRHDAGICTAFAGAFALPRRAQVVARLNVPVAGLLNVFGAHFLDVFQADHVAQGLEEGAAEVRLQAERDLVQAHLDLLIRVEFIADPRVLGERNIAHVLGVFVGVGVAVKAIFRGADPAVGGVSGRQEHRVEIEFLNVPIRVVIPAGADGTAKVEVVGDLHGHGRRGAGTKEGEARSGQPQGSAGRHGYVSVVFIRWRAVL